MALHEAKPHGKAEALKRGERRYRRKVASPKQWAAIHAALSSEWCFVCGNPFGRGWQSMQAHHLVSRAALGDDVIENLVPLHEECHKLVTERDVASLAALAASVNESDARYAYCISKLGENAMERLFGVTYEGARP